jgi:hypothetical protein
MSAPAAGFILIEETTRHISGVPFAITARHCRRRHLACASVLSLELPVLAAGARLATVKGSRFSRGV